MLQKEELNRKREIGKKTFYMSLGAAWFPVEKEINSQLSRLSTAKGLGTRFTLVGSTKVSGLQVFCVHLKFALRKIKNTSHFCCEMNFDWSCLNITMQIEDPSYKVGKLNGVFVAQKGP